MRFLASITGALLVSSALIQAQSATRPAPTGGRYVAIGCIAKQGTGATARYVVTDRRSTPATSYRLDGDKTLLEQQVGHTVEVAGPLTRAAGASTYTLKVTSLVWIKSACGK